MKLLNELSTAPEPLDSSAGTLDLPVKAASDSEPPPTPSSAAAGTNTTSVQIFLIVLGTLAFLYFARAVVLPVFLACVAGMALKPLIRWLSHCHISHEIQHNISNYLFAVSLINIGLGMVVSGGLYFLGVPNAAMWGMLVAVLNFVPYFGPVAGVILLATVGLITFDTLWKGLLPPAWYLLLHLLEANFVTPMLLGRRFTLNPVVIFVFLIFWTWLWGVPGALLSVPILVSIKVVCDRVPKLSSVSELLTS